MMIDTAVPNAPISSYIECSDRYTLDRLKMSRISFVTAAHHCLTGFFLFRSSYGVLSAIHGRAGDVAPAIRPAPSTRSDFVAVLSKMFWLRRLPGLRSSTKKRPARGSRTLEISLYSRINDD